MLFHNQSEVKKLFVQFFNTLILISINFSYLLAEQAAKPWFNYPDGKYHQPIQITIQSATKNARIYYTRDGNITDSNSIPYSLNSRSNTGRYPIVVRLK